MENMRLKFKRTNDKPIMVKWNPKEGIEYPLEHINNWRGHCLKYRNKEVVKYNGKYYYMITPYDAIDASSEDHAMLGPLEVVK